MLEAVAADGPCNPWTLTRARAPVALLDDVGAAVDLPLVAVLPLVEHDVALAAVDAVAVAVEEQPLRTRIDWIWIWMITCWETARRVDLSWTMTWTSI